MLISFSRIVQVIMGKRKSHEISSDEEESVSTERKHKAKKSKSSKDHLDEPSTQALLSLADIDPDDEIWIVKVPSHVSILFNQALFVPFWKSSLFRQNLGIFNENSGFTEN